ncbi:MAG TPA: TldD/PmbA family protein [Candidatus Diapherotrites archaeon]|nr:TldD/PmbA family protein [Candidatus Diapherotrites archaeon]
MNKQEIFELCQKIAKKEHIEFIYSNNYQEYCDIKKFDLEKIENKENTGLFIRVIENGQTGTFVITQISEKNILQGIQNAKKIAKLKNNIKINDFGCDKPKNKTKYKNDIKNIDFSEIMKNTKKQLTKEKYFKAYDGYLSKMVNYNFYVNPYVSVENNKSTLVASTVIVTKDKKPSNGYYKQIFTETKKIDIPYVFQQAKENAKLLLNPIQGVPETYDIILNQDMTAYIIEGLILSATKGENIEKKDSYLWDQIGKQTFSKNITIIENPFIDDYAGSSDIDDEGFKCTEKKIIEKGVFKHPIYDQTNAEKYQKKPTGNGFRPSLYSNIMCGYTNILQKPGNQNINDIISKTKNGIIIYGLMGMHMNKLTTGEFSLTISNAKHIENGKLKDTITNLNFTGNIKETFKNAYFSKEQKFFGDSLYSYTILENKKLI